MATTRCVGGDGNDTIATSLGNDSIDAGDGNDLGSALVRRLRQRDHRWRHRRRHASTSARSSTTPRFWTTGSDGSYTTYTYNAGGGSPESVIYARGFESVLCFAEGTRIATPRGEVPVEQLRIGDLVMSAGGGVAVQPVVWIGRLVAELARHPRPELARPVLFRPAASAMACRGGRCGSRRTTAC